MSNIEFGHKVIEKAQQLAQEGRDPNQTAKILCDADPLACNYGIGIILDRNGNPYPTSPTLLKYVKKELETSTSGSYMNSMKDAGKIKEMVLQWQRVPQEHWDSFIFAMPSDAGTGSVKTGLEYAALVRPGIRRIGIEELGWPAYSAIAGSIRLGIEEYPTASVIDENGVLPLYQSGPMNTTGAVMKTETVIERAEAASRSGRLLFLDPAYSGFEFAHDAMSRTYDAVMKASFARNLEPFIENGVSFILAVSPTKAFCSFALRPAGFLFVFVPERKERFKAQ